MMVLKEMLCRYSVEILMIFLSFRFYVKSILGILRVQNLPFYHIWEL